MFLAGANEREMKGNEKTLSPQIGTSLKIQKFASCKAILNGFEKQNVTFKFNSSFVLKGNDKEMKGHGTQ